MARKRAGEGNRHARSKEEEEIYIGAGSCP